MRFCFTLRFQPQKSNNHMAIDTIRRSLIKATALATGATINPIVAAAACNHSVPADTVTSTAIRGTGLVVSFGEKPSVDGSRQVIVTNTNDQPVTLSYVYPGIVSTPDGQYDLNSLLVNGSREFAAKHATTLTIKVANGALLNQGFDKQAQAVRTSESTIHVRTTYANVNGGRPVTTVRQLIS